MQPIDAFVLVYQSKVGPLAYFRISLVFHLTCNNFYGEGTPSKLATATQPKFPRIVISLS
jgi:hypothetical protein